MRTAACWRSAGGVLGHGSTVGGRGPRRTPRRTPQPLQLRRGDRRERLVPAIRAACPAPVARVQPNQSACSGEYGTPPGQLRHQFSGDQRRARRRPPRPDRGPGPAFSRAGQLRDQAGLPIPASTVIRTAARPGPGAGQPLGVRAGRAGRERRSPQRPEGPQSRTGRLGTGPRPERDHAPLGQRRQRAPADARSSARSRSVTSRPATRAPAVPAAASCRTGSAWAACSANQSSQRSRPARCAARVTVALGGRGWTIASPAPRLAAAAGPPRPSPRRPGQHRAA